jgi:hypothetical protein
MRELRSRLDAQLPEDLAQVVLDGLRTDEELRGDLHLMPEPVRNGSAFRLTVERPRVPAVVRRPFLLAALAVLPSRSIGALICVEEVGLEPGPE